MEKKRMPKSLRKFIRREKSRIRREILPLEHQKKSINELYQKLAKKYENKGNIPNSDK